MINNKLLEILKHPLIHGSTKLLINTGVLTVGGFVFWIVAARFYSPETLGKFTTFNSIANIVSGLGVMGLSSGVLRFIFVSKQRNVMINTSLTLSVLATLILTLFAYFFLPKEILHYPLLLAGYAVLLTISEIIENALIGLKNYIAVIIKNFIFSVLKVAYPLFLVSFDLLGLINSLIFAVFVSLFFSLYTLISSESYQLSIQVSKKIIGELSSYSFNSLISGQAGNVTTYLIPILITYILSPESTAYYAIVASISGFLFIIPRVISQALLVETVSDEASLNKHFWKSIIFIFALYIPAGIISYIFANQLLLIFGKTYSSEGLFLLKLMIISGLLVCINYLFGAVLLIKKYAGTNMSISVFSNILMLLLGYYLLQNGLNGIGYAFIFSQLLVTTTYTLLFMINKNIRL